MKVIFETVSLRNFLSYGNVPVVVPLNKHQSTLIFGTNARGKTTIPTAISFGLFGKTSRGIKKQQYINSINKKECVVELVFSIGPDSYKIIRGLKPDIFEVYKNGALVPQNASVYDYQDNLERNILHFNFNTFHQIVFLSSTSYTPFMMLRTDQRREVIEELLDINIFSKMKTVLKERDKLISARINSLSSEIRLKKEQFRHAKEINKLITTDYKDQRNKLLSTINDLVSQKKETEQKATVLQEQMNTLSSEQTSELLKKYRKDHSKLVQSQLIIQQTIKQSRQTVAFFEENKNCPTCSQKIDEQIKKKTVERESKKIETNDSMLAEMKKIEQTMKDGLFDLEKKQEQYTTLLDEHKRELYSVSSIEREIKGRQKDLDDLERTFEERNNVEDSSADNNETVIAGEIVSLTEDKEKNEEESHYLSLIETLLKDKGGIKSSMVSSYIPVINRVLSGILAKFDFFVSFQFDENFQEIIRSRHRDAFSYASFSAGQQARIDLAILFTWREIAKMRGAVSTNILCLDEIFDSSLDQIGQEKLIEILGEMEETNVMIISHSSNIIGMDFDRKIEVTQEKNFSKITVVEEEEADGDVSCEKTG